MTDLTASVPPMPSGAENCNPPGIGFWPLVAEDFRTHERDPFSQGFSAIAVHRLGNWRMGIRHRLLRAPVTLLYRILYKLVQILGGIDLPYTTIVGRRVKLEHFGGMILVARSIGDNVIIRQNTTFGVCNARELNGKASIGNRVDIGAGAVLLGHIRIGDGSVIGANAVVLDDVPPGSLAVGVPARIIDTRDQGA